MINNIQRRDYLIILGLIVGLVVLAGCSVFNDAQDKKGKVVVKVKDKTGDQMLANVRLLQGNTLVESQVGKVVSFTDLKPGDYQVVAKKSGADSKPSTEAVVKGGTTTNVEVEFSSFTFNAQVHEIIFSSSDNKKINIENLKQDENIIMGVSPLDFSTTDGTKEDMKVSLNRVNNVSQQSTVIPETSGENPPYRGKNKQSLRLKPPVFSITPELKQQKQKILSSMQQSSALPSFDGETYEKGETENFYIQDGETQEWLEKNFTMKGKGEHCYIFVDNSVDYIDSNTINNLVQEFEKNIYPTNTDFFSSNFDIDGNNKLTILLVDKNQSEVTMAGYFHPKDFFSQSQLDDQNLNLKSNEGDIIYINTQLLDPDENLEVSTKKIYSTIAHEFQHELWYYQSWENGWIEKKQEQQISSHWINEGMSTYAEQKNGYWQIEPSVYSYFTGGENEKLADNSLTYWRMEEVHNEDYGIVNLFVNYIVQKFGENVLHEIYNQNEDPITTIEDCSGKKIEEIFMDFMVANKLHSLNLSKEYSYEGEIPFNNPSYTDQDFPTAPLHTELTSTDQIAIRGVATKYYQINGTGEDVEINIQGDVVDDRVGVFIYRY